MVRENALPIDHISSLFLEGAETIYRYTEQGNVIVQFLVNYQDGVSREIQTAGANIGSGNGGNGGMRLLIVDPEENVVYTGECVAFKIAISDGDDVPTRNLFCDA